MAANTIQHRLPFAGNFCIDGQQISSFEGEKKGARGGTLTKQEHPQKFIAASSERTLLQRLAVLYQEKHVEHKIQICNPKRSVSTHKLGSI